MYEQHTPIWPTTGPLAHLRRPWVLAVMLIMAMVIWHASRVGNSAVSVNVLFGNQPQPSAPSAPAPATNQPSKEIAQNEELMKEAADSPLGDITSEEMIEANREEEEEIEEDIEKAQGEKTVGGKRIDLSKVPDYKFGTCDLFDGEWFMDTSYKTSAYDPSKCGVEGRWNCGALYKQEPFGSAMRYEQYQWKPMGCSMPTMEQIAKALKPDMKILVIGDSLLLNQYASLKCMLQSRPDLFGKFQVDYIRDNFLVKCLQGQDFRAGINHATRNILLEEPSPFFLENSIKNYDLILMGTGHHYGMPPEVVYTPAVVQLASDALTYIIRTVNKALYEQMGYTGVAVWQGYPPRHFQGGDWDSGGKCTINDSIEDYNEQDAAAVAYETAAQRALKGAHGNIKHLNITFLSMNRRDAHPSGIKRKGKEIMDCSHFCLPGVPDLWNSLMLSQVPTWIAEATEERMLNDA